MKQYKEAYFSLLTIVCKETGNSKYGLHEDWKRRIFKFLIEDENNFVNGELPKSLSTKYLSEQGWENFYNEWRHFCLDFFHITN